MKIKLRMPELNWRQETVEVPKGRVQALKEALRVQQERINEQVARRNEETTRQLDKAARSGGGLRKLGLGVLLGAGAGLLLAPTEGKAARSKVRQYLQKVGKQAASSAQAVRAKVGGKQGQEQPTNS